LIDLTPEFHQKTEIKEKVKIVFLVLQAGIVNKKKEITLRPKSRIISLKCIGIDI
jgi:hypothetical protein